MGDDWLVFLVRGVGSSTERIIDSKVAKVEYVLRTLSSGIVRSTIQLYCTRCVLHDPYSIVFPVIKLCGLQHTEKNMSEK